MRILSFLFLLTLLSSCDPSNMRRGHAMKPPVIELDTICQEKMIQVAEYFSTHDTAIKPSWHLQPGMQIWIDSTLTAQDFKEESISTMMTYPRREESQFYPKINEKYLNEVRSYHRRGGNSKSALSVNRKGTVIWFANNTKDTFYSKSFGGFLLGLLQAQDRMGRWRAIQMWRVLQCGTGYSKDTLLPGRVRAMVSLTDISGPFKTKIRFKLYEHFSSRHSNRIYYSKEFETSINYCQFWHEKTWDSLDWSNFQTPGEVGNTRLH